MDKFKFAAHIQGTSKIQERKNLQYQMKSLINLAKAREEIETSKMKQKAAVEALKEAQLQLQKKSKDFGRFGKDATLLDKFKVEALSTGAERYSTKRNMHLKLKNDVALSLAFAEIQKTKNANNDALMALEQARIDMFLLEAEHADDAENIDYAAKLRQQAKLIGLRRVNQKNLAHLQLQDTAARAKSAKDLEQIIIAKDNEKVDLIHEMNRLKLVESNEETAKELEQLQAKITQLEQDSKDSKGKDGKIVAMAKLRAEARVLGVQSSADKRRKEDELRNDLMRAAFAEEHRQIEDMALECEKEMNRTAELEEKLNSQIEQEKILAEETQFLSEQLSIEASKRKKLHNKLEDMKGAIRVYARIRPLSASEVENGHADITKYLPDMCTLNLKGQNGKRDQPFTFDGVFSPAIQQQDIFQDVEHLIQSAIDGYNVCIFAYGQTGSGKTWTMAGNADHPGIQPRAVKHIFKLCEAGQMGKKEFTVDYTIKICMVELYLEHLIDLLANVPGSEMNGKKNRKGELNIQKDPRGRVEVGGAMICSATNIEDMMSILQQGQANRKVSSTKMNSESSRSHLISTILIEATDRATSLTTTGKLSLIDLAGSETQKKSGATGTAFQEAKAINKSLSCLGLVISSLTSGNKKAHVPYRNSKLTLLLQDGLGGNAKTLLFVNASPADYNFSETCSSFRFALRCKEIKNVKGKAAVDTKEVHQLKKELKKLRYQVHGPSNPCELEL